jgi:hypothetical protein
LHEQRTIFSTDGKNPATLSFLAPSEDYDRTVTENRKKSMAVIASIYNVLRMQIPNQIARYSDEFYPTSTGDNFMRAGIPVILFEGGHFPDDYQRFGTRKYYPLYIHLLYGLIYSHHQCHDEHRQSALSTRLSVYFLSTLKRYLVFGQYLLMEYRIHCFVRKGQP